MADETKNPDYDKTKTAIPPEKTSAPTAEAFPASDMPMVPSSPEQQGEPAPEAMPALVSQVTVVEEKVKDEVEIQIDLLKDKDWFLRKDAAITLDEMADDRAIGPVI